MKIFLVAILVLFTGASCAKQIPSKGDTHEHSKFEMMEDEDCCGRRGRKNRKSHHNKSGHHMMGRGTKIYKDMPVETKSMIQDVKSQYRLEKEKLQSAHHIAMLEVDTKLKKIELQIEESKDFDPKLVLQYEELRTQVARLRSEQYQKKHELKEQSHVQTQKIRTDWLKTQLS